MMRILLLFIIVGGCQQKKRGVVCERVDAHSGQCTQQLATAEVKREPPAEPLVLLDPLLPLPAEETTDNKIKLEDITVTSKCLSENCLIKDSEGYMLTCTVLSHHEIFNFDYSIGVGGKSGPSKEDSSPLCRKDIKCTAESGIPLRCGMMDGYLEIKQLEQMMPIDKELLERGVCLTYTEVKGVEPTLSMELRPPAGCQIPEPSLYSIPNVIELTFSNSSN